MHKDAWKSLSSKIVYENKWGRKIREHQIIRPTGEESTYAVFEVNPAVTIIALTELKEIYILKLFRFPIQQYVWQLPCGGIEDDKEIEAAKRELKEETGLEANKWTRIGEFFLSPGSSNEKHIVYLAEELSETSENEKAEEGIIEVQKVSLETVLSMITAGEINDATIISPILMAAERLNIGIKSN